MKNQEILNALNKKIKAAEKVLLYLNQTKAGLERVIEKHKSPAEEEYKRWWGEYPGTETWTVYDETRWVGFQKGYNTSYEETVSKYQPTPQEPEQVEQGLRDAMKTAKENGVFDEPESETLTLKQLLKKWEFDFSGKWVKNMITSELYEEEVERFIQMFMEWMPDAIGGVQDDWDDGYNSYHNTLMRKLK